MKFFKTEKISKLKDKGKSYRGSNNSKKEDREEEKNNELKIK